VSDVASAREETGWQVLFGGDRFIPAGYCVDALAQVCGPLLMAGPQPRPAGKKGGTARGVAVPESGRNATVVAELAATGRCDHGGQLSEPGVGVSGGE
jgi:hypothetical protein